MAIRKFRLMATSEIAEATFRSLQEIDDYLKTNVKKRLDELDGLIRQYQLQFSRTEVKSAAEFVFEVTKDKGKLKKTGGGSFKVDKFTVPKMDTLRQNFSVVDELTDEIDALKALYNKTKIDFQGMRGLNETLAGIKSMQQNAETKMNKALAFLKTVGDKYAPTGFLKFIVEVMSTVAKELTFKSAEQTVYAYESADGALCFTNYIKLTRLTSEDGDIYPEFWIVFSCELRPLTADKKSLGATFYVNVLHEFTSPAKARGREVDTVQKAVTTLGAMFSLENVGTGLGTVPHGLDPSKWSKDKFSMKERIHKFSLDDTSMLFEFVEDVDEAEATQHVQRLYLEVKGAFGHIKKARIKVRPEKVGKRRAVRFTLTNLAAVDKVSTTDIDFLKEYLGLDDNKLRQVIRVLNKD